MRRLLLISAFIFAVAGQARAWNAEGHIVVAQIAYNHLTPGVKSACDALMAVALPGSLNDSNENSFVPSSVWPDTFKSTLGSGNCHFYDLPFTTDSSSLTTANNSLKASSLDVVRAIRQCVALLQSSTASQVDRAIALRYLIHYVGDVHQPLHGTTCVTSANPGGDLGGNLFAVTGGTFTNLHGLWDAGGGYNNHGISQSNLTANQSTINGIVTDIETTYPFTDNSGSIPDPYDWVLEDLPLAQNVAYVGITAGTTPSSPYLTSVSDTAKQRLGEGGHRLADLLNTIMVGSSDIPTLDVTEPELFGIGGSSAPVPGALAVDASGGLIVWDSAAAKLLNMSNDGVPDGDTYIISTQAAILGAIDAANGTDAAPASITALTIQIASDGDIIFLCTASGAETLLSIANTASGAVAVVSSPVSGGGNLIDGAVDFCMSGNTAYIAEDTSSQSPVVEDRIVAVDTNDGSAPSPTVTVVSTEAQLNSATGTSSHSMRPGPMAFNPSDSRIWLCDSGSSGTSDNWIAVTPGTGAAVLGVAKTDTLSDLVAQSYSATDVGYAGAAFDAAGNLYCTNQFGAGTSNYSIIELAGPGGGAATTHIRPLTQVQIDAGGDGTWTTSNVFGGSGGTNSVAYSSANARMYAALSISAGSKGIVSYNTSAPLPVEMSGFAAE